jgi:hypothetical protein
MEIGRKWVKAGDINDYDSLIKLYPVSEYEWGGTSPVHVIPQPLVILHWAKGLRVGFQNSCPQVCSASASALLVLTPAVLYVVWCDVVGCCCG